MRWAAPEILAGEGTRTKEADVYALGMTLLEAVTGAVPFSGKDDIAVYIAVAVKQQMPERPEEFPSFTSDEASRIWEIIVDSCAYRSSARPGSSAIRNRLQNMRQRPKELAPELTTNVFNAGTDGFEAEVQMYLSAYKDGETTAGFFAPGSTDSADIIHTSPRPIYIEDGSNNNNSRDPVAYAPRMVAQLPQSEKEQGSQNNTTSSAMSFVAIDPLTTRQKLAASMLSISSKPWFRGRRVFPRSQQQAELPNPSSQEEYSTRYHNDQREQTPQHKSHSGSPVVPLPSPFGFTPPTLREVGMSPSRPSAPAWYSDEELAGAAKPTPPPRKLHGPRIESLTLSPTSALPESLDRQSPVAPSTLRPAVIPPPTPLKRLGLSHLSTRLASPVSERSAALGAEKPAFQTPEPVVPPQLPSPAVEEPEPVLENLSSPTPRASADSGLQDTEPCEEEIKKEPEVPTQELSVEYYKFRRSYIPATVNPPHLQRPIATSMGLAHTPNVKAHNRPPRRVSSPPQPRNLVTPRQRSTIISSPGLLPGHPRTPVALIAIPMPLTDARVRARGYGETYVPPIPHIDTPNRQSRQPARRMSASLSISSTNAEAGLSSIAGSGDSKG
ncbi:Leucine-rich repeat serine/threonine-protein kinase 2 [Ceratobasidium sp. 395]|nr:Leucine-rich repeat serine/threonine-protein kinase 2 [Ceratobasidium sp. 395]